MEDILQRGYARTGKNSDAAIEEGLRIGVSYQDMIKILEEREGGKADA
mgnify:CR=1 FL=1